jgi:hypothetical protein
MLTAHPVGGRTRSLGPPSDPRNNPCRRQDDQVVAPSWTRRRLLVEDDHGASGGRRYRGSPYWVAGGVGGPSSSRRARMPGRASRWGGSARPRSGRSRHMRFRAPVYARFGPRLRSSARGRTARSQLVPSERASTRLRDARFSKQRRYVRCPRLLRWSVSSEAVAPGEQRGEHGRLLPCPRWQPASLLMSGDRRSFARLSAVSRLTVSVRRQWMSRN